MLAAREAGGIIFTTVQKFALLEGEEEAPEALNERTNVVVISDEAHRSQYGLSAAAHQDRQVCLRLRQAHARCAAKASFIGFTGTPISSGGQGHARRLWRLRQHL
jgi:type I restriction enzyme R subunit